MLLEVTRLHGGFILGFPEGLELTSRADKALSAPAVIAQISGPTSQVLGTLSRQRRFLSERARHLAEVLEAALHSSGWTLTRVGYSSYVTVRNFLIEIGQLVVLIDKKGGTLTGGMVFTAAASSAGMNAETLGALISFLHQNSSDILSFAAPFPELRAWIEWIINFLDEEKKRPSGKGTERGGST